MQIIEWDDSFLTGIETIDKQHKRLFDLLKTLCTQVEYEKEKKVLENTLEKLFDYTKYHFSTEEYLMRQANYSDYKSHKSQHEQFIQKVKDFTANFIEGKEELSSEIVDFLVNWVKNHISQVDKEYISTLKK